MSLVSFHADMPSEAVVVFKERCAVAGLVLPDSLRERLLVYFDLLQRWNRKINLTSLSDPAEAVDRLLVEPLAAARHLPQGARLADLGSGGGSPAIPLALALGSSHLLMIESRSRKAAFLREAARHVDVAATVETLRLEALETAHPAYRRAFDVVSLRAVRPDAPTLAVASWLARRSGQIALFTSNSSGIPVGTPEQRSTWNIGPSAMLVTFHVEHPTP